MGMDTEFFEIPNYKKGVDSMYTELFLNFEIPNYTKGVDYRDKCVLEFLFGDGPFPDMLPDHPLFGPTTRWQCIGRSGSFYFQPRATSTFFLSEYGASAYVVSRSDFKNYDGEIQMFVHWIRPYVRKTNAVIGWFRYEEDRLPTLIEV